MPFILFAAIAVGVFCQIKLPKKFELGITRSARAWCLSYLILLGFLALYGAANLIEAEPGSAVLVSVSLVMCSVVSLWRDEIRAYLADLPWPLAYVIEGLILLVGAYLTFVSIELPSNQRMTQFWWEGLILEITIILFVMVATHFMFQRSGVGPALSAVAFELAGIAEYFVVEFKNVPIMASDILALGTAAAVGGGYTYILKDSVLLSLALLAVTILVLSFTPTPQAAPSRKRVALNLVAGIFVGAALGMGCFFLDFADTFGISYNAWIPLTSYWREGFVTSFITQLQSFRPDKPKGYSNEAAEELLATYVQTYEHTFGITEARLAAEEQFAEEQPSVVVIMNESFADLSVYDNLAGSYTGPVWWSSFDGALAKGKLYVSPYGGGTCNSEWEFLTGASMAFMGSGVYPYMVYDHTGIENLAATFKNMGYRTIAMHPNLATNWYRNVVYPTLGFDEFLDINSFIGAPRLRNMVTDEATYDKTLELLEQDAAPQFIFNVTMQNHGGYKTGALPEDMVTPYYISGQNSPETDEYLALIDESDRALQAFIEKLDTLDRKVIVVFFGDHQPNFPSYYNNWLMTDDPDELTHEQRTRTTDYLIYANYDVEGAQTGVIRDSSTNYLAADMMQLVGGPLTDYQKAEMVMRDGNMPLLNLLGYADSRGRWYDVTEKVPSDATGVQALRRDIEILQYHLFFSDGVHYQTGSGYSGTVWGRLAQN